MGKILTYSRGIKRKVTRGLHDIQSKASGRIEFYFLSYDLKNWWILDKKEIDLLFK